MKKITIHILILLTAHFFSSCEKMSIGVYEGEPFANFYDENNEYRRNIQTKLVNFYYEGPEVTQDTVWFKIVSIAATPKKDYNIMIRAYKNITDMNLFNWVDAESGKHYLPFDSEEMKKNLVLREGSLIDSIPIIVLRDPSLKNEPGRRLTLRMVDSDDIKASDQRADDNIEHSFVTLYISDGLTRPQSWDTWFFLGVYGQVKHDFMVRHSGERWDDDFISSILYDTPTETYYKYKFRNELEVENAERLSNGLDVLKEADGTIVEFPY